MGSGRKQSRRARRYLTGRRGSLWTNPGLVMAAAGLAWGAVESLQRSRSGRTSEPLMSPDGAGGNAVPTPDLPPVPTPQPETQEAGDPGLRLIRLAISAANADGTINDHEQAAILQQAKAAGLSDLIDEELKRPRPLAGIVAGVTDPKECATLYVLVFTILRADEQVTPAERIYLAQLAHLLQLDRDTVAALEKDTGERIDALGDQGQLGG